MSAAAGTTITGKTLLARLRFAEQQLGAAARKRVLARLPPDDQKVLGGILLPVGRYPLVLNARLDGAIAEAIDPANPKRVFRLLGRSSAELNFDQFHATLIARNDPHVIMSRIGAMRRLYYEEGEFGYERVSATSARIFVRGMSTVTTPDCESTAGFYEVAIARSGGRDVDVRHHCRLDGDPDCTFDCSWRI
ncbi:MAG TPA: TIGR02265 family protein [Polyangia bacterium]